MAVIRASGVTKRFEQTCALERVDLEIEEGEVRGLLGPNGAGKTTLLRVLFGLVASDEGTIELFGRKLDRHSPLVLNGVSGFVEEPAFYPYLSGRANLEVLAQLDGEGARERIDGVLKQVQMSGRAGDRVGGYSSGMRQRLGVAAALMRTPRLLLLDEPTSALDPAGARFIMELVRALSRSGVAILLSSHHIGELEGVCDSFSVLSCGRVVWDGSAERMQAQAPPSAYRMATSDDARALQLADEQPGIEAERAPDGGLTVEAIQGALDAFVLVLGRSQVAVRELQLTVSPLESMFFALTEQC
jgi:ABC-2 type transport system ATP-binding protein